MWKLRQLFNLRNLSLAIGATVVAFVLIGMIDKGNHKLTAGEYD